MAAVNGPLFVIERSACGITFVTADALLLPGVGSVVDEETMAVLVTFPLVAPVVL